MEDNEVSEDEGGPEPDIPEELFDEDTRIWFKEAFISSRQKKIRRRNRSTIPGENARPDDQGELWTCSLHAIAKAMADGCQDRVFRKNLKKDFKQDDITNGEQMVSVGKYPQTFSDQDFQFEDAEHRNWSLRLYVRKVNKGTFEAERKKKPVADNTHLLVYLNDPKDEGKCAHCVYAKKIQWDEDDKQWEIKCINSYKNLPKVCIPLDQEGNTFYSVFCRVNKVNGQNTDTPEERRKTVEVTPEEYELAQQELTDLQERRKTEQVTQEQYELVQETTDSSDSRKIELAQDETTIFELKLSVANGFGDSLTNNKNSSLISYCS